MKLVRVSLAENLELLNDFLNQAGESLKNFRYFQTRPFESIKNHLVTYIALNKNNKPVCYGHLDKEKDKVWLGVCVVDSERGKGYGTEMVDSLLHYAYKNNIGQVFLSVDKDNVVAIKLYIKNGFQIIKSDREIIFFCKDLNQQLNK
jgi:RimJ/RimL family protein N-acetyltransferase